jgi:hypothetical protein
LVTWHEQPIEMDGEGMSILLVALARGVGFVDDSLRPQQPNRGKIRVAQDGADRLEGPAESWATDLGLRWHRLDDKRLAKGTNERHRKLAIEPQAT